MNHNDLDEPLSIKEKEAFASLPREKAPPAHLALKVLASLKEQGLVKTGFLLGIVSRKKTTFKWMAAAFAAMVLVSIGFLAGKRHTAVSAPAEPRFVLFLYSPAGESAEDENVEEYVNWIRKVRKGGKQAGGEKLMDSGRILQKTEGKLEISGQPLSGPGRLFLGGYFIIEAKDYEEATRVAAGCPHLKYGGVIELRQIDSI